MTKDEAIEIAAQLKIEYIDILKTYYHKNEPFEQNLKKYNILFKIPVSGEDLKYIIETKSPDLDRITSINRFIEKEVGRQYGYYNSGWLDNKNIESKSDNGYMTTEQKEGIKLLFNPDLSLPENIKLFNDHFNMNISYRKYYYYRRKYNLKPNRANYKNEYKDIFEMFNKELSIKKNFYLYRSRNETNISYSRYYELITGK